MVGVRILGEHGEPPRIVGPVTQGVKVEGAPERCGCRRSFDASQRIAIPHAPPSPAGEGYLEEAVVAYRNAFEERTRERNPLDWALTQNNLGKTLFILGEQEDNRRLLEQASTAYLSALEVIGTAGPGRYRDVVQSNLGEVLLRLRESQP